MNSIQITQVAVLEKRLLTERSKYRRAFDKDKQFSFIKEIQVRIRQLEKQMESLFL